MANPQFTLGANSYSFSKAPVYPVRAPRQRVQAIDRTAAGGLQVESLGAGINRRVMAFRNLPAADYAGLISWFDTIANGAANAFAVTDEDSNSYSARWVNGFNFEEDKAGYTGSIELEIIA
jgi:hypothetical protein